MRLDDDVFSNSKQQKTLFLKFFFRKKVHIAEKHERSPQSLRNFQAEIFLMKGKPFAHNDFFQKSHSVENSRSHN